MKKAQAMSASAGPRPHPDGGNCDQTNSILIEMKVVRTEEVVLPVSQYGYATVGSQIDEMLADALSEEVVIEQLSLQIDPRVWERMRNHKDR